MFDIIECPVCKEKVSSFFKGFTDEEFEELKEEMVLNKYKPGETLFREGNMPVGLYWINHGKVKLYKPGAQGREQIVRLSTEGELLGYRSMICNERYAATAETIEQSYISFVSNKFFNEIIQSNSALSSKLMELLCKDLRNAEEHTAGLAQQSVRERVADVLLYLYKNFGTEEDGKTLQIKLQRKDLAALAGTANETLIRLLRDLKDEAIIDLDRKFIKIEDPKRLENVSMGIATAMQKSPNT